MHVTRIVRLDDPQRCTVCVSNPKRALRRHAEASATTKQGTKCEAMQIRLEGMQVHASPSTSLKLQHNAASQESACAQTKTS